MTLSTSSKLTVIVDTNVILSGTVYGGNPEKILKLIAAGILNLVTTPEIEAEVFLKIVKFPISVEVINDLKALFGNRAKRVTPKHKITVCRDPKDNKFLDAILESKADYLITGDKDLLALKAFKSTKIVAPKEFLKLLE